MYRQPFKAGSSAPSDRLLRQPVLGPASASASASARTRLRTPRRLANRRICAMGLAGSTDPARPASPPSDSDNAALGAGKAAGGGGPVQAFLSGLATFIPVGAAWKQLASLSEQFWRTLWWNALARAMHADRVSRAEWTACCQRALLRLVSGLCVVIAVYKASKLELTTEVRM